MAASSRYETFSIEQKSDDLEGPGDIEQPQVPVMSRAEACLPPSFRIGFLIANLVFLMLVAWEVALFINNQHLQRAKEQQVTPRVKFLAIGDWGREGQFNQRAVADAMAAKAAMFAPDFIVSTGDNFYESGLHWSEDPQFNTSFIDIYNQSSLQIPWHAVLGNHDYGEMFDDGSNPQPPVCQGQSPDSCFYSPVHQLSAALSKRDWRWHCERSYQMSLANGTIDLFFIDTNPLMSFYSTVPWANARGGLLHQCPECQLAELEAALAQSKATWKVVIGHHPIYTNLDFYPEKETGTYNDTHALLAPLLDTYGVQAYIHGHDHVLYHIDPSNVNSTYQQFCSGAGSKLEKASFISKPNAPFQQSVNGFVAVDINGHRMTVDFIGLGAMAPIYSHVIRL